MPERLLYKTEQHHHGNRKKETQGRGGGGRCVHGAFLNSSRGDACKTTDIVSYIVVTPYLLGKKTR